MRFARIVLVLPGLAALAWGIVLFGQFVLPFGPRALVASAWLVGGPVVHDAVVAPLVAVAGLVLVRYLPPAWRGPVIAGAVVSAVLAVLAVPLLWRDYGAPPVPGLHDTNVVPGLLAALGVVWALAIAGGAWNAWRAREH